MTSNTKSSSHIVPGFCKTCKGKCQVWFVKGDMSNFTIGMLQ